MFEGPAASWQLLPYFHDFKVYERPTPFNDGRWGLARSLPAIGYFEARPFALPKGRHLARAITFTNGLFVLCSTWSEHVCYGHGAGGKVLSQGAA